MNILFVLRSLEVGGVEVVTTVLANKFSAEGHNVSVFAFYKGEKNTIENIDSSIKLFIGNGFKASNENIILLRSILYNEKINIIINQWGLPFVPIRTINKARKDIPVKVISIFHNDPLQNGRIQSVETDISRTNSVIKKSLLSGKRIFYRLVTGYAMRYIYNNSDVFEALSISFVEHFKQFTGIRIPKKLIVQTNPITIDTSGFVFSPNKKQKEIIYVGRIDYIQKRVYRIFEVWNLLESFYPDWKLTIVGDGEERNKIEHMVSTLELKQVIFEGFQFPRSYYERASILILTSEFEGFPLVLAECMSFGVVPAVYGSYSAVYDIIEDGVDGLIVPKTDTGFDAVIMAERIKSIMDDSNKLSSMALAAIEKSKNYSIDKIYNQWMKILKN